MRIGINGMGRIGRLALRASLGAMDRPDDDPDRGVRRVIVAAPCGGISRSSITTKAPSSPTSDRAPRGSKPGLPTAER